MLPSDLQTGRNSSWQCARAFCRETAPAHLQATTLPTLTTPESLRHRARTSHPLPPALVVTSALDESGRGTTLARSRRKTVGSESTPGTEEWIDLVTAATASRRKKRAPPSKSSSSTGRSRSNTESSFFPKLARILESGESNLTRKSKPRGQYSRHRRESKSTLVRKGHHERSDSGDRQRSPVKQHRVGSRHRRSETFPRFNPSLLSVLSSLTRNSDHSSGSGTTITQESFDRQSQSGRRERPQEEASQASVSEVDTKPDDFPNVFDYLDATMDENGDGQSVYSSSLSSAASHYQRSDAGSSELPDTPSSHSTFPSPSATRSGSISGSVAELRRKYDAPYAASLDSRRSGSRSPEAERSSPRNGKKLPQLRDVAESDELDSHTSAIVQEAIREGRQRNMSLSYAARLPTPPETNEDRLKVQQDALRQHVAQEHHHPSGHHRVDSAYGQHRSYSSASTRSTDSQRAWAQYMHDMQVQQYQYASPAISMAHPVPRHGMNGYVAQVAPPPAPDAPDNTQQTIAGYEMLARELSNDQSAVKPIYRRFEYLNHRILLHMQDELQEMEEQLRRIDEIIATLEPPLPAPEDGRLLSPPPASRRSDKNYGGQWHLQRTELLGRIFLKTKDYNAAVASFANLTKDSAPPEKEEVAIYRDWLSAKSPIHEVETRFLSSEHEKDLIIPGTPSPRSLSASSVGRRSRRSSAATQASSEFLAQPNRQPLLACAFSPILPLLLFNMIPTFSGRLFATILITSAAVLVATTTKIGNFLSNREWCVCAAAYVLVSVGIAGCVPQQH
ncbi:hypothetical protein CERZMDRAFT_105727 [Cercospora zeae-maydis SCOH1-5]|uniref:DUF6594 domain-containing protein n=1 Tax=Cercospora zeae-maydis SCOH1-5 TaxID=717836 RepID=A0A6A6FJF4_9PEZI|nr:hypothetical protein CERZMDRAFT_105727 [Cercospora zeae-maydis SCOH1-5]